MTHAATTNVKSPADTRRRIVETAMRLFHEHGFHATGLAAIRAEAGVNSGSVYHFFSSKLEIAEAVLEAYRDNIEDVLAAPIEAAESDPLERVFGLLDFYGRHLAESDFAYGCPIGRLALEIGADTEEVRRLTDANFAAWRGIVARWLETWRDRAGVRIEPVQAAYLVLAVMEGAVMQCRAARSLEPMQACVAQLRACFETPAAG